MLLVLTVIIVTWNHGMDVCVCADCMDYIIYIYMYIMSYIPDSIMMAKNENDY